ncbi:hypothetical protein BHM03_00036587 [Ensete ventricosum]|nr:hypothetical protein BHM03_00036587 [Ensete ventricosum]
MLPSFLPSRPPPPPRSPSCPPRSPFPSAAGGSSALVFSSCLLLHHRRLWSNTPFAVTSEIFRSHQAQTPVSTKKIPPFVLRENRDKKAEEDLKRTKKTIRKR